MVLTCTGRPRRSCYFGLLSAFVLSSTSLSAASIKCHPRARDMQVVDLPSRICVVAIVDSQIKGLLADNVNGVLDTSPASLASTAVQAIEGSLTRDGMPGYGSRGEPRVRAFDIIDIDQCPSQNGLNPTVVKVTVGLDPSDKPYLITVLMSTDRACISESFRRDAIMDAAKQPIVSIRPSADGMVPMRLGLGWSLALDVQATVQRLTDRVRWREHHE